MLVRKKNGSDKDNIFKGKIEASNPCLKYAINGENKKTKAKNIKDNKSKIKEYTFMSELISSEFLSFASKSG